MILQKKMIKWWLISLKSTIFRQKFYLPFITLTYKCNLGCYYCSARRLEKKFPSYISIKNFKRLLKWLKNQKIKHIMLWGGEPTTHPKISEILDICKIEGMKVCIFTNNFFDDSLMKKLTNDYIFNVKIDYSLSFLKHPNYEQYNKNLENLHKKNILFDFFCRLPEEGNYDDLIKKLKKYKTYAEGSIIIPGFSGTEISIKKLRKFSRNIIEILRLMRKNNVNFIIKRPVPRCIFSKEEWKYLKKYHKVRSRCYPGAYNPYNYQLMGYSSLIVINPDLSIFPCTGTFLKGPNILSFKSIKELDKFLKESFWEKWRWSMFLMKKCKDCNYFINRQCQGGCLNYKKYKLYKGKIINIE
jgi:radical SAM protein with 4Fe4S-binding SPASM domain